MSKCPLISAQSVMLENFRQLPRNDRPVSVLGGVRSLQSRGRHVDFDCGDAKIRVGVLAPNLVRVRLSPDGQWRPRRSWAIAAEDESWTPTGFELNETPEEIAIATECMEVRVRRESSLLACVDPQGREFARDLAPGMHWRDRRVAAVKAIEAQECFYGLGQRTGLLEKRGTVATNWTVDSLDYDLLTDEMYQAIPFLMVLRPGLTYGIFLNSTNWSRFDLGETDPNGWRMETDGGELDYYIIYGSQPSAVVATYTQLTGRPPLPPKWAIGYHQSRWSYESQDEVRAIAREFRDRRIPCDVIHLDIDYMRGYRVFTWHPHRFSDPGALMADLRAEGFKTVTIVDPGIKYEPDADYEVFDRAIASDYLVRDRSGKLFHGYVWPDKAVFPDFVRPEVRQWWGNLHQPLTDIGIAGIWNDMNEPAIADRPFGDPGTKIWFPEDAPQGPPEEGATHAEVHNLYGHLMARSSSEAMERHRPEARSFVLTRSGYAGIGRWSAVWMGDNQSRWEYLEMSLPMLCNMGLSGVPFVGCDIGGFFGNATPELFARWMQVGMLYPLMRGHSALGTRSHEPWCFGDRVEQICREFIELRYRLLPYFYTLFWEATTAGTPILRPLLYEFPDDEQTYTIADRVMVGPWLMAAPVCRPGVSCQAVYLPAGVWYDWWTGQHYRGPTQILAETPLERMPLYVRAGAVIPLAQVGQFVGERAGDRLTVNVWPPGESGLPTTFIHYEDDGESFAYREGDWATTAYRVRQGDREIVVEIGERQGHWTPPSREVVVEVVGIGRQSFEDDGRSRSLVFEL